MEIEMEKNKLLINSQVNEDTILTLFDNVKLIIPSTLTVEISKDIIRIINRSKVDVNLNDEEWNLCNDVMDPKDNNNMLSSFYVCPNINNKEMNSPFHFNSFYPLDLNINKEEDLNHSDSDLSSLNEEEEDNYFYY